QAYNLGGFTSGAGCIAPRSSVAFLGALKRRVFTAAEKIRSVFQPLEDYRDALSPIRPLLGAVTIGGSADLGAMLPLFAHIDPAHHGTVGRAACELLEYDHQLALTAA